MEECEALCTRLVIMVNGQFKCLGSPQHLKTKFGNGYKLSVRLNEESESEKLFQFMASSFPTSQIQETHRNLFEFVLPFSDTKLSKVFGLVEKNRQSLNIKDYSVNQSSLDQIFVNFAKEQNEEEFVDMKDKKKDGKLDKLRSPLSRIKDKVAGLGTTAAPVRQEAVDMQVFSDMNNNEIVLEVKVDGEEETVREEPDRKGGISFIKDLRT